jgi:photosystem II stability/assembly factor-like uncharacterized protein
MRSLLLFFGITLVCNVADAQWIRQQSGTTARLRGLAVVDKNVVWASGTQGTYVRTIDGGVTWKAAAVPGATNLDFRDVHAFDASRACLLSIGEGEKSRIYQTIDGGATWSLRYTNRDPRGFLDAIAFWDADHGIAMGDAVDGRFTILTSADGGATWKSPPKAQMPPAQKGEGAFAASGTCLIVEGERNAWFGTGGAAVARVFRSTDRGQNWTVHETPITAGNASAGIFSLAFRDALYGVAVGGDYKAPEHAMRLVAKTSDGGLTWTAPAGHGPAGYRSAVSFVPGTTKKLVVAAGPTGSDLSSDGGQTWTPLGKTGFHAIGFAGPIDAGWGVGDDGTIARHQGTIERGGKADGDQADPPSATSR